MSRPCQFDQNGECLICDCYYEDCAWDRLIDEDYKWEDKKQLEKMFAEHLKKEPIKKEDKNKMNILNDSGRYFFYNSLTIETKLAPKNYLFNFDAKGNCFLEDIDGFKLPEKIYDIDKDLRLLAKKSFAHNDTNLGVLLTGNKGQGKSVTAKLLCTDMGLPVVVINKPIPNEINFIKFLKEIKQDYVLFIDEFEKLFKSTNAHGADKNENHSQESFLSFMDGVLTNDTKTMFLLTTNESVNEFLINRPSRIKFMKEYNELPEELFDMIVDDKLENKSYKEDLEQNVSFLNLNIDLLINIINDINMLDKPFSTFANLYNYKFEQYRYDVYVSENGAKEKWDCIKTLDGKPKYSSRYLAGYDVEKMIKLTKDEIVFESTDYDDKEGEEIKVVVRMVPVSKFLVSSRTMAM